MNGSGFTILIPGFVCDSFGGNPFGDSFGRPFVPGFAWDSPGASEADEPMSAGAQGEPPAFGAARRHVDVPWDRVDQMKHTHENAHVWARSPS